MPVKKSITAVILAGGRGSRLLGADKGLVTFKGMPLVEHVLAAISPQVNNVMINANRNVEVYQRYGYPVIEDGIADYQGPLAGFACALENAQTDYVATLPCDSPFISPNYIQRLVDALNHHKTDVAVAFDGQRLQPVHALLSVTLLNSLIEFINSGERKTFKWYDQLKIAKADFSDEPEIFNNINTQAQLDKLTDGR